MRRPNDLAKRRALARPVEGRQARNVLERLVMSHLHGLSFGRWGDRILDLHVVGHTVFSLFPLRTQTIALSQPGHTLPVWRLQKRVALSLLLAPGQKVPRIPGRIGAGTRKKPELPRRRIQPGQGQGKAQHLA